jgi:hypothetical protein
LGKKLKPRSGTRMKKRRWWRRRRGSGKKYRNSRRRTARERKGLDVFKYNQQDATLRNGIYYYQCSTYFRRFLRPSSGAQNCIHSIGCFIWTSSFMYRNP